MAETVTVIENQWIPLKDGTRLAARLWLPDVASVAPVPAILEFLPYRKRNGTSQRDEANYPMLAAAGIAGIRVDLRGAGDSEGVLDGENKQELPDAAEIIAWIAAQSWSNGNVGMWGISWGGGNTLRVAAMKPPALKAVISNGCSIDRYRDMIRYKGGTHLGARSANLSWQSQLTGFMSRPPDPQIVGDRWREMWRQRLENQPFYLEEWLSHQRRDAYWRRASINENFDQFPIPALFTCGWSDCYRNSPFELVEGMPGKAKVLIGPWGHQWPHLFARPGPSTDFATEAIAWWNHWLRDEPNGADKIPQMRAFILDGPRPSPRRERDPGYWVAKNSWTNPNIRELSLDACGTLVEHPLQRSAKRVFLSSPLDTGTAAADHYTGMPDDQRIDDGGSLVLESEGLEAECVLLGRPSLRLTLSSDSPLANIAVRLIDVHPDGTGMLISYGVLNLAHRVSDAEPMPLVPGKDETVMVSVDPCGYRIAPGHRIRLSISTAYWPVMLPPPYNATLDIDLSSISLSLPLLGEHERIEIPETANLNPLPTREILIPGETRRWFERDLENGITNYCTIDDDGLIRHPGNGLAEGSRLEEKWSIAAHDPLSMTGECRFTITVSRTGWETTTHGVATLSCTKTEWIISQAIEAHFNGEEFFSRTRSKKIRRDFM
ncbi:CocE/NonD family hydrolase [Mesorhizobium sp. M0678]|uniref:CocE/NonD family hydrolase n=1 Tax=Mesorhizobium sp. M0678 TaxID=2956985 RepID=UPI00333D7152